MEPRIWFQGINSASLCSLVGRYDNHIPTHFLAPIDSLKIPAQELKNNYLKMYIQGRFAKKLKDIISGEKNWRKKNHIFTFSLEKYSSHPPPIPDIEGRNWKTVMEEYSKNMKD